MAKLLEYQELMNEEGIEVQDLPKEIRMKINVLKPTIVKYNDKPSEKLKASITKLDLEIANLIQDYIDQDLDEEDDEEEQDSDSEANAKLEKEKKKEEDAAKKAKEEEDARLAQEAADAAEARKLAEEEELAKKQKYSFGTHEMEQAILAECGKNNGHIDESKLSEIIKRSPKYPIQEVFSISLKKQHMRPVYVLLSN